MSYEASRHRDLWNWRKLARATCASLSLCASLLIADWSSSEVVYPSSSPYHATNPSIATDNSGNCIAVWVDTSGSGSLHAARIATTTDSTGFGDANWIPTDPIATSNVHAPSDSNAQMVGMDGSGNSTAAWTDGTHVYVSTLELNGSTWSTPLIINTPIVNQVVTGVYIASAYNGNVGVTWNSSVHPYDISVITNMRIDGAWTGAVNISTPAVVYDLSTNPIAMDPVGNAVILFTQASTSTQAVSFNANPPIWTTIYHASNQTIVGEFGVMDSDGNATIVWIEQDHSIHAATLPYNTYELINARQLSTSVSCDFLFPLACVDAEGNVIALWIDESGSLGSATYSTITQHWTILSPLSLGGDSYGDLSLSGDSLGNAVASWTAFRDSNSYIQAATFRAGNSTWNMVETVSSPSDTDNNSHIILTETEHAILVWENDITDGTSGTINSAIFTDIVAAIPISPFITYDLQRVENIYYQAVIDTSNELTDSGLLPPPSPI